MQEFSGAPSYPDALENEHLRQESTDSAQQCLCCEWIGISGDCSEHRLLVVSGGRDHPAPKPKYRNQDVSAFWPLEGLLFGRYGALGKSKSGFLHASILHALKVLKGLGNSINIPLRFNLYEWL